MDVLGFFFFRLSNAPIPVALLNEMLGGLNNTTVYSLGILRHLVNIWVVNNMAYHILLVDTSL